MSRRVVLSSRDFESRLAVKTQPGAAVVGFEERKRKWDSARSACAQALVAEPQILLYFKCKNRNPILSELAQLHAILCKIIELVQEVVDFVPGPVPGDTSSAREMIERTLQGDPVPIPTLLREVTAALQPEVKGAVVNKRLREAPSLSGINALLAEVSRRLTSLKRRVSDVLSAEVINEGVQELARRPVLQKLHQALGSEPGPQRVIDCVSSLGALNLSSRRGLLKYKVSEANACPVPFKSVIAGASVTLSVSPSLLDIQVGDTVFVGQSSAEVVSISQKTLTLSASLPSGTLTLHSPTYAQFESFQSAITPILSLRSESLERAINLQNRPSVADLARRLAALAAEISALTRDASAALSALGVDAPSTQNRLGELRALQFEFSADVVDVAETMLRSLRDEGFVRAADSMLRGDYGALFNVDPRDAADGVGSIDASLAQFSQALRSTL